MATKTVLNKILHNDENTKNIFKILKKITKKY